MADINYIGSISLGKIQRWTDKKASTITPIPFPGKDSGQTEGIDTLGVIAYINFSGRWTGDFDNIQTYITSIKGIMDGQQTSSQTLKSPFVNAYDRSSTLRRGSMGMTTSQEASKLKDTSALFLSRGTAAGDKAKNLVTGQTATINSEGVSNKELTLSSDIFPVTDPVVAYPYAVTAAMNVKVISVDVKWGLPGLSFCDYEISVMQVA